MCTTAHTVSEGWQCFGVQWLELVVSVQSWHHRPCAGVGTQGRDEAGGGQPAPLHPALQLPIRTLSPALPAHPPYHVPGPRVGRSAGASQAARGIRTAAPRQGRGGTEGVSRARKDSPGAEHIRASSTRPRPGMAPAAAGRARGPGAAWHGAGARGGSGVSWGPPTGAHQPSVRSRGWGGGGVGPPRTHLHSGKDTTFPVPASTGAPARPVPTRLEPGANHPRGTLAFQARIADTASPRPFGDAAADKDPARVGDRGGARESREAHPYPGAGRWILWGSLEAPRAKTQAGRLGRRPGAHSPPCLPSGLLSTVWCSQRTPLLSSLSGSAGG